MSKFETSDSWIFLTIAQSSGETLRDFHAVADYLNVSIPNDDEIEDCVNRLVACGLVSVESHSFSTTEKGREVFESIKKLSKDVRSQVSLAAPLLASAMTSPISQPLWRLDPEIAAEARRQYFEPASKAPKR